jgi:4-amino-4-deoxy-L-arabinose transferase-like glycosyltransferase
MLTALPGVDVLRHVGTRVASDPGDPLLSAAILTWNAEHVVLSHQWWQFPIFHTTADVLAFSEQMIGLAAIGAPIYWLTGQTLPSYNLTLLLTYPLCGLAMYALVFRLTGSAAAFLAGLAYLLAPFRGAQLSHVHLLATFYTRSSCSHCTPT